MQPLVVVPYFQPYPIVFNLYWLCGSWYESPMGYTYPPVPFVMQEDIFHPTQSVLEAVMFQSQMRLASNVPYNKKLAKAQDLIALAGLSGKVCVRGGKEGWIDASSYLITLP